MAKIVISELDIDVNALIKSTAEVKTAIDVIKNQQKEICYCICSSCGLLFFFAKNTF